MPRVSHRSQFDVSPDELFEFHLDASNLVRISPPFPRMRMQAAPRPSREGDEHILRISIGPFTRTWTGVIFRIRPPEQESPGFTDDRMIEGPFREWRHQHQVHPYEGGAVLRDVIQFRFLPTALGSMLDALLVAPVIKALLIWRHGRTRRLLKEDFVA